MRWNNRQLKTKEDWARAFLTIETKHQAAMFLAEFRKEQPEQPEEIIGYLSKELPSPKDAIIRELFGVEHPVLKDGMSQQDIFRLGVEAGERMSKMPNKNLPAWFSYTLNIPRESWSVDFPDEFCKSQTND